MNWFVKSYTEVYYSSSSSRSSIIGGSCRSSSSSGNSGSYKWVNLNSVLFTEDSGILCPWLYMQDGKSREMETVLREGGERETKRQELETDIRVSFVMVFE